MTETPTIPDWQAGGFGLYIHWPFCKSKCPYCDFNSHVSQTINQAEWLAGYLKEIERIRKLTDTRVLHTVFFGGGTPSLMDPDIVHQILNRVRHTWPCANDMEITLEANPSSVEAARFHGYAQAGVNRISMGIQALNATDLRRLGRIHTVQEAQDAFDIARRVFDRVSFDLIYARQDQSLADWCAELTRALTMAVDHLSLYQLTIEDGTAFSDRFALGILRGLPVDELAADMYKLTQDLCGAAGFEAYEVSNHAKPGSESRHNLIYWRCGDYAGIGPGAHGRLTLRGQRKATEALRTPAEWLSGATLGKTEFSNFTIMGQEQANEYVMMGLRLAEGIDPRRYQALCGRPLNSSVLDHLASIGMIGHTPQRVFATRSGRLVLNAIIKELLVVS